MNKSNALLKRQLDNKIKELSSISQKKTFPWLKLIREALAITSTQAAKKSHVSSTAWRKFESNEERGTISLNTLKKAADALDCDLVYALIPRAGSIENAIRNQALDLARHHVNRITHTMALEDQEMGAEEKEAQIKEIAEDLIRNPSSDLWKKV